MKTTIIAAVVAAVIVSGFIVTNYSENGITEAVQKLNGRKVAVTEEDFQQEFINFVATYKKSYLENVEFDRRYAIFKNNLRFIQEHNARAGEVSYQLAMNKFGDLTNQEYRDQYVSGYIVPDEVYENPNGNCAASENMFGSSQTKEAIDNLMIPASIDWRTQNAVTKVKDQGKCGACYAFAAIAAIDSLYLIHNKGVQTLSEQQLIDCSDIVRYGNKGCDGGHPTKCYRYIQENDMCSEKSYPYTGTYDDCLAWNRCNTNNYISSYKNVEQCSKLKLYEAIAINPVSVAVDAGSDEFRFYSSGVFDTGCGQSVNHAVAAIGYGTSGFLWWSKEFILLKNSWGTSWGISGFMKISSEAEEGKGTCGVYMDSSYPVY